MLRRLLLALVVALGAGLPASADPTATGDIVMVAPGGTPVLNHSCMAPGKTIAIRSDGSAAWICTKAGTAAVAEWLEFNFSGSGHIIREEGSDLAAQRHSCHRTA